MTVTWSTEAEEQLALLHSGWSHFSLRFAREMSDQITRASARLGDYPLLGRVVPEFPDTGGRGREVIVHGYRLIYEVFPDRVEIIGVIHGRQDLGA